MPSIPCLPHDLLVAVMRYSDEPTRDCATQVSSSWLRAAREARQLEYAQKACRPDRWTAESLPTVTELTDRGCPKPSWRAVLATFDCQQGDEPLRATYQKAAALQRCQNISKRGGSKIRLLDGYRGDTDATGLQDGFGVWEGAPRWGSLMRYEGWWKNGMREGLGYQIWADGMHYEGNWKDDEPHGKGLKIWPNGVRYEGYFEGGKQTYGVQIWPCGTRYEGYYKNNRQHGQGVQTDCRARYEGKWENGNKNGLGMSIWADGKRYVGHYKNNKPDGEGECFHPNGMHCRGQWKNGYQDGWAVNTTSDGGSYEGECRQGLENGYGVKTGSTNGLYRGCWMAGKRNGIGIAVWPNGWRYQGQWKNNEPHGYGIETDLEGVQYAGLWSHGQLLVELDPQTIDTDRPPFCIDNRPAPHVGRLRKRASLPDFY